MPASMPLSVFLSNCQLLPWLPQFDLIFCMSLFDVVKNFSEKGEGGLLREGNIIIIIAVVNVYIIVCTILSSSSLLSFCC